jgi:hypothetical protein
MMLLCLEPITYSVAPACAISEPNRDHVAVEAHDNTFVLAPISVFGQSHVSSIIMVREA